MGIRLRYLAHDLEVPFGEFVIGRSADCQLSLDDPLVSRRHGLLTVSDSGVTVEDLGSRNGVFVNGTRISGRKAIADSDRITIGSQEMLLLGSVEPIASPTKTGNAWARQTQNARPADIAEVLDAVDEEDDGTTAIASRRLLHETPSHPDKRVNALSLIGGVADKALALGRLDEAERILNRSLTDILVRARMGAEVQPELAAKAGMYAARLANATGRGSWIDYIFELNTRLGLLLPGPLVDDLYSVLRKVKSVDMSILRGYVKRVREGAGERSPAERFILQRIEGLERLGALK
ncbi:FHA domain-containing protein [Chondromyces apiculatus]|uniref:Diguanylate cyclase (GGDEF domain) n=1 Tax=Chondromyces apiculatus DSM 436 TaxID=1192034 RepID=A0A017SVL2_9BACT|nr:FHA domain-containing protein [Chondromyces apiculatus]EYF00630.1 diguanylate cyclase (GGDEF domain) [Chondromyces apiculatus DSM 436]